MSFTTKELSGQQKDSSVITAFEAGRSVTVYTFTFVGANGAYSSQSYSADFDSDRMELHISEKRGSRYFDMTYSVVRNPYKGYSDDPRGRFDYCASQYYF